VGRVVEQQNSAGWPEIVLFVVLAQMRELRPFAEHIAAVDPIGAERLIDDDAARERIDPKRKKRVGRVTLVGKAVRIGPEVQGIAAIEKGGGRRPRPGGARCVDIIEAIENRSIHARRTPRAGGFDRDGAYRGLRGRAGMIIGRRPRADDQ